MPENLYPQLPTAPPMNRESFNVEMVRKYYQDIANLKEQYRFPRINARGVYFKIRDFRGGSFEGGVYFKISRIVETGYGRTKIRKHSCPVINVICTATCQQITPILTKIS